MNGKHNMHQRLQTEKKISRKKKIAFGFVIFTLIGVQLYLLNSLSTYGAKLDTLEKQINEISSENDLLESQVASGSAVATIAKRSTDMGLTTSLKTLSLSEPIPVAYSRISP